MATIEFRISAPPPQISITPWLKKVGKFIYHESSELSSGWCLLGTYFFGKSELVVLISVVLIKKVCISLGIKKGQRQF